MLIFGRQQPYLRQHRRVGAGAADVLPPQLAVEPDGGVDVLHDHRWTTGEASAPLHVGRFVGDVGHEEGIRCMTIHRRSILAAAAGTLAATAWPRKPVAETLPPLAEGLKRLNPPADVPDEVFLTRDGASHHLSEFKGRGMVVNLWATWCAPCVAEMPSLEILSKALAPQD